MATRSKTPRELSSTIAWLGAWLGLSESELSQLTRAAPDVWTQALMHERDRLRDGDRAQLLERMQNSSAKGDDEDTCAYEDAQAELVQVEARIWEIEKLIAESGDDTGGATRDADDLAYLEALIRLSVRLASTFRSAQGARDWMHERNRYLKGRLPVDEIRAGHPERVDNALEVIDSGIFV